MKGVDPYSYMHQVAMRLDGMTDRDEIEETLDTMEYLFEVIPPEMQENAETLISVLRERLKDASINRFTRSSPQRAHFRRLPASAARDHPGERSPGRR